MARSSTNLRYRILNQARQTLVSEGYRALSMRRLADSVGCTATSIYLYFQNKDALFHALIDEGIELLHQKLVQAGQSAGEAKDRLQDLAEAFLDFGLKNPEYYEVMFLLHPEHMERYPAEKYRKARENLEFFAQALAEDAGRPQSPTKKDRLQANVVWASLHGAVSLLLAGRVDVRLDQELFLNTLVKQFTQPTSS